MTVKFADWEVKQQLNQTNRGKRNIKLACFPRSFEIRLVIGRMGNMAFSKYLIAADLYIMHFVSADNEVTV